MATQHNTTHLLNILLALAAAVLLFPGTAGAATLDVCASGCTYDSIADAVDAAFSGDTIELDAETFNEGGIVLDKSLRIRTGSGMATIDGGSYLAVFIIDSGVFVDLEDLQLKGGSYARIDNSGDVDLETVYVIGGGPSAPSTYGGLLNRASGSMTLDLYSVVANNASVNYGGGLTNYGNLDIELSTVTGNHGFDGGGLLNLDGSASVATSSFSANNAENKGGAWANVELSSVGDLTFFGSASTSSNSADVDCDTSYDEASSPADCVD